MYTNAAPDVQAPSYLDVALSSLPSTPNQFTVGVFDGDAGGLWDAGGAPTLQFTVYPDPALNGSGVNLYAPVAQWTSTTLVDNGWVDTTITHSSDALSAGRYNYRLRVEPTAQTSTGGNNFKIRTNGNLSLAPQAFAFTPAGQNGAARAIMRPANLPRNYDGTWTFAWEIKRNLPTDVLQKFEIWDGDFDYGSATCSTRDTDDPDTNGFPPIAVVGNPRTDGVAYGSDPANCVTGAPADDYSVALLVESVISADLGAGLGYSLTAPDGQRWVNINPSGNREWEHFAVDTLAVHDPSVADYSAAVLPFGVYKVKVEGLDLQNTAALYASYPMLSLDPSGNPIEGGAFYTVRGVVWNDLNLDGVMQANEGVSGVTVLLDGAAVDGSAKTAVTDSTGAYSFRATAGTHLVSVIHSNFSSGNPLYSLKPISVSGGSDNDVNTEDAVVPGAGGSKVVVLDFGYRNQPPVAVGENYVVSVNHVLTVPAPGVIGNDSDPDDAIGTLSAQIGTGPAGVVLSADGSFTFSGSATQGTVTFTYQLTDPRGASSNFATVNILIKAGATAAAQGGTFPYDGASHPGTCTVLGEDGTPLPGISTYIPGVGVAPLNSGSYVLSCDFGGNESYGPAHATAEITITPLQPTALATGGTVVYDGNQHLGTCEISGGLIGVLTYAPGGAVAPTNVGTYDVLCDYAGDGLNQLSAHASSSITVNPRALTITADPKSKTYGDGDPALTYQLTAGSLVGTDAFTGALGRVSGESVGTYGIQQGTVTLGGNYSVTYVPADLTITPRAATITAGSGTKVYGSSDPVLTPTSTGFQPTDGIAVNQTARDAGENAGVVYATHATATGANIGNYDVTNTPGTLTITKATVTVTANPKTITYGDLDPAFDFTYGPFSGPDGQGKIDTAPTCSVAAHSDAGSFAITCSGGGDNNYDFEYAPATLTVTPRAVTITADAKSKMYGDGDPALTYQLTTGSLVGTDAFTGALGRVSGESVATYGIQQGTVALGGNYNVTYIGANLTINPRAVTITADAKSKMYGDGDPALTYQLTAGSLVGTDAFTGALGRVSGENVGTYGIQQGTVALGGNYNVTYVGANLTITPKTATITAGGGTKVFGASDPALSATTQSGFAGGDVAGITLNSTRAAGEDVGNYTTTPTATGGNVGNYTIVKVTGTFSITPATPVATATGGTFPYDGASHGGTCTISGGLVGVLTYTPGGSTAPVAVGNYTVNCDYAGDLNHNPAHATATITIVAATVVGPRMTGGGTFGAKPSSTASVTHGFELHCAVNEGPNNLQANWGNGERFHLQQLQTASCTTDPSIKQAPPSAPFNTYTGTGWGYYNGTVKVIAKWVFTDAGEPGTKDKATLTLTNATTGQVILSATGSIAKGNQQAHKN